MASKNKGKFKPEEAVWLILFLLLGTVVLWSVVVQQTLFGTIYQGIFLFTVLMFILAKSFPDFAEFQNLNRKAITLQIIVGMLLGFALVSSIFFAGLTLLSPLSIPDIEATAPLGILGFELLSSVFLMSILVPELEESFRACAIRPTIAEWLSNRRARTVFLLVTGIIIYMIIQPLRLLGLVMALFALVDWVVKFKFVDNLFKKAIARNSLSIIVSGAFFAVLHLRAYGGTEGSLEVAATLMMSAFFFAVIADTFNTIFKSATMGKVAHCGNNAVLSCVSVGLPPWVAVPIVLVYSTTLFIMSGGTLEDLRPKNIIASIASVGGV